jgi:DNA-binding MarR family transcriptional regulator
MAKSSQEKHIEVLGKLVRELRQFHALGASFFRAAAARVGMTVTDMQVIDLLESAGPMSAGQLAELTGLTTGAITGMLNRLEEAGRVRRERDPNDARKVIVRLESGKDDRHEIGPLFDVLGEAWEELASHYSDEQLAFLLEFLQRSNALSRQELARLQEAPESEGETFSAPLGDVASGQLVVSGAPRLAVRADDSMVEFYQARFEGPVPDVKAKDEVVTIRYPRRLWLPGGKQRAAEVTLNVAIPWQIIIQGAASEITAELDRLTLSGLEVKGGMSMIRLELPTPLSVVPIRISGGALDITVRRPAGVPARVHLKGWVSTFIFDDQRFSNAGNNWHLHSPGYEGTAPGYDIEVASSASMVTITSG